MPETTSPLFTLEAPVATPRLRLRRFGSGDERALHEIHGDPEVVRYVPWGPYDATETEQALVRKRERTTLGADGDSLNLAVELSETGELIGDCVLFLVNRVDLQGEIGFLFNPRHQGRGYAREAVARLLEIGFEGAGLHRIAGRCDARNHPSARLMGRLGMRLEAELRETHRDAGGWAGERTYAMLAPEWRART